MCRIGHWENEITHTFKTIHGDEYILKREVCSGRKWSHYLESAESFYDETYHQIPVGIVNNNITIPHPTNSNMVLLDKKSVLSSNLESKVLKYSPPTENQR